MTRWPPGHGDPVAGRDPQTAGRRGAGCAGAGGGGAGRAGPDDDYASLGKRLCDWDDSAARDALVDALVRDVQAALAVLHGEELTGPLAEAAQLLALVAGQDVEAGEDGVSGSRGGWRGTG